MNPTSTKWFSPFWKSLFTWRNARRALISAAIFATLLVVFYAEENWRGKRAWENCKRELEAKGANFDWASYVPAPVPDEQNVFKAPKMTEWFVRKSWTANLGRDQSEISKRLSGAGAPSAFMRRSNALAEIIFITQREAEAVPPADVLLNYSGQVLSLANSNAVSSGSETRLIVNTNDGLRVTIQEAAHERLKAVLQAALDPGKPAVKLSDIQRRRFVAEPLPEIKTVRLVVFADHVPKFKYAEVKGLLPRDLDSHGRVNWQVEVTRGGNVFNIRFPDEPVYSAAGFLAWSDQFEPEFATIREGLRRPHVQIVGDFQRPFGQPIPDFVCLRNIAQLLAERAQCCLILGKSEQALKELTLLYDLRRLLGGKPSLLVAAMIDVAITGLYTEIIADGLALRAWREPELIALQKQLADLNLPAAVLASLRTEGAATCQTLQHLKPAEIIALFGYGDSNTHPWKKFTEPTYLLIKFAPRGWVYQNLVAVATAGQGANFGIFDAKTGMVYPGKIAEGRRVVEATVGSKSPYAILARVALPNFSKAMQTTTRNQTMANEAFVVCALERFRMARGEYPEALGALVPSFADSIPTDLIGGRPLNYQRNAGGKFELYGVGWNETDEGGTTVFRKDGPMDAEKGDWVWPMRAR